MRDRHHLRKTVDGPADEFDVVTLLADRHDAEAALLRRCDHLPGIAIVDIDYRGAVRRDQVGEQPQLGGEIVLYGGMVIEMIARKVREGTGGDTHAVEAILIEAVRGRLEREMGDAFSCKFIERAVHFARMGRGERAVGFAARRDHADGADASRLQAERGPDLAREGGDRGLAASAGDRYDGARLARREF